MAPIVATRTAAYVMVAAAGANKIRYALSAAPLRAYELAPLDVMSARLKGIPMSMCALVAAVLTLGPFNVSAQTNATQASTVGTWKLDLAKSSSGSGPAPKAVTLTILKDTPELTSWRLDVVEAKGESMSFSWSGPLDGSLQPLKGPKGQVLLQESLTRDKDGALLRHGEDSADGSSFDARATLSADGNTLTDVVTSKTKDGKTLQETMVYHRVTAGK